MKLAINRIDRTGLTLGRRAGAVLLTVFSLVGCGSEKKSWQLVNVDGSSLPSMPTPMPGQAAVAGTVADGNGNPIAGATIKVAETDGTATSDANGAYQVMVPSDSTVTLFTSATGFAPTYRDSIIVADQAMISGFDVLMLSADTLSTMNGLGTTDPVTTRGLMAVRLHSLSSTCVLAGAHLAVWPPKAASVFYSRPSSTTGGLDQPDGTMSSVQADVSVDAWLTAVVTPGNMLQITVDQPDCHLLAQSPSLAGLQYPGARRVDAQALTVADLFLN